MSETTKKHIQSVKNSLTNASDYVADAVTYAKTIGDVELSTKIEKIKSSIKETSEYIASRTGTNS